MGDPETKQRHDSATFLNAPTKPEAYLLVVYPPAQQAIHFIATPALTLGRAVVPPQADLTFEDAAMSRLHAARRSDARPDVVAGRRPEERQR
ncbi:MAG: hypothetical protein MUF34_24820 [Polyangiaceae bacterium]|nr:hypothetical protein [Polyangiaceae bacterium]